MTSDPARTFFPDDEEIPSLYTVLSVSKDATPDDLKRSFRRLSLAFHPDKLSSSTSSSPLTIEQATLKFQQIGFAYSILKDEKKREKYDRTGSTEEGTSGEGAKTEQEWKDYFKDLWDGEVTSSTIEEFTKKYQGSEEELQDLYDAYNASSGDLEEILSTIMCSTHSDETRFGQLINTAISSGQLEETKKWKKSSKDSKGREVRKKKAEKEEKEAEKLAKELGVHDKLYGRDGQGKGKGKAKEGGQDGGDEESLKALIQGNRDKRMNSLMDSLEAKYGGGGASKKKRASTGGEDGAGSKKQKKGGKTENVEEGPTEEEFARIQAEMDARRTSKNAASSSSSSKENGKARGKGAKKSK